MFPKVDVQRRLFLRRSVASAAALAASGLVLPDVLQAAGYVVGSSYLNVLSKANAAYSTNIYYLLFTDSVGLPSRRSIALTGKAAGTQVGESDQCVALVKALSGAPQTTLWKPGRQVIHSNLPRGTAIAKFEWSGSKGSYSQSGAGHCGILIGLRSTGGFDLWDQNWGQPSVIRRHTISGSGGGVYDPASYYEIVT